MPPFAGLIRMVVPLSSAEVAGLSWLVPKVVTSVLSGLQNSVMGPGAGAVGSPLLLRMLTEAYPRAGSTGAEPGI